MIGADDEPGRAACAGEIPGGGAPAVTRLGERFEILGRLGAQRFRARDRELGEVVALRLTSPALDADPLRLERLRREVKRARCITSPHVCRIHELVELAGGDRGVTAQLLEGRTLAGLIADGAGRDWMQTVRWAADVAEGLGAAHALGIVHRDLTPESVMVVSPTALDPGERRAVILDFGVAFHDTTLPHALGPRPVVGTPLYMAPEQLTAGELDGRADLYALGLVIAELLTREVPLSGLTYQELLDRRVSSPARYSLAARAPQVPEALDRIVGDLLAAEPAQRPSSAFYVASELRALLSADTASPPAWPASSGPVAVAAVAAVAPVAGRARHWSAAWAIAAAVVTAALFAGAALMGGG